MASKAWLGLWHRLVPDAIAGLISVSRPLRRRVLSACGLKVDRVSTSPNVWSESSRGSMGDGTSINYGCMFKTTAPITIGESCSLGMGLVFVSASHEIGRKSNEQVPHCRANTLRDGTWLGASVMVWPASTLVPA